MRNHPIPVGGRCWLATALSCEEGAEWMEGSTSPGGKDEVLLQDIGSGKRWSLSEFGRGSASSAHSWAQSSAPKLRLSIWDSAHAKLWVTAPEELVNALSYWRCNGKATSLTRGQGREGGNTEIFPSQVARVYLWAPCISLCLGKRSFTIICSGKMFCVFFLAHVGWNHP